MDEAGLGPLLNGGFLTGGGGTAEAVLVRGDKAFVIDGLGRPLSS